MILEEVRAGEPITAEWANTLVRAVRQMQRVSAAAPLRCQVDSSGLHLSLTSWPRWELCELTTELSAGSSAKAVPLVFVNSLWTHLGGCEFDVFDSLGDKNGLVGDRLWAYYSPKSLRWEIVQLAC
ncbi:MAG: hypothetical protein KF708_02515 [Pirellulales bacterium]|nr:hypothetical protein [Pirellulales bacterium]